MTYPDTLQTRRDRRRVYAPPEAELAACSVSSNVLQVEFRGDDIYRLLTGSQWADFRVSRVGAIFEAFYVAGNVNVPDVPGFEIMAACRIAMEVCEMETMEPIR